MSIYQLIPPAPRANSTAPFVTFEKAFSDEEIQQLVDACAALPSDVAKVGSGTGGRVDPALRRTEVAWLTEQHAPWVYSKLAGIVHSANSDFYRFDLYGFIEDMQYTVYYGNDEGYYTWHIDSGKTTPTTRKLSVVLQLSDPDEYEGGDLQLFTSADPTNVDKQKGLVAVFPSYTLHRVTPVTKGTRRTLVVWVGGPDFR